MLKEDNFNLAVYEFEEYSNRDYINKLIFYSKN